MRKLDSFAGYTIMHMVYIYIKAIILYNNSIVLVVLPLPLYIIICPPTTDPASPYSYTTVEDP